MLTTIEELWSSYSKKALPEIEEYSIQYTETKKAFYAGCIGMFSMMLEITNNSESVAEIYLESLNAECNKYVTDIIAKRN